MPTGSTKPGQDLKDSVLKELTMAEPGNTKGVDQGREGRGGGQREEQTCKLILLLHSHCYAATAISPIVRRMRPKEGKGTIIC